MAKGNGSTHLGGFERHNAVFMALPLPSYLWQFFDGDLVLVDCNEAAINFSGSNILQLLGSYASELYKTEPEILHDFEQCIIGKASYNREMTYKLKTSGEVKYLSVTYTYIEPDLILVQTEEITERKNIENSLTQHVNQYTSFIKESPAALAMFDREIKFMSISNKWLTDYKLEGKEVLGKLPQDVFPENGQYFFEISLKCLNEGGNWKGEDTIMLSDGTLEWIQWEVRQWHKPTSEIGGVIMFSELITERKKAEQHLKESENRFHLLANNALVGIFILKSSGFSYVNSALTKILGYTEDEMLGKMPSEVFDHARHEFFRQQLESLFEDDLLQSQFEFEGLHRSGSKLSLEVYCSTTVINDRKAIIGSLIDITDRKLAQEKIKKEADKLLKILQNLPVGLSISNAEGKFTFFNNALIGYTIEDVPDLDSWWPIAYPDESERNRIKNDWNIKIAQADSNNGKTLPMEASVYCKDGSYKTIKGYRADIGNESITIFQDVSDLKRKESQLLDFNSQIILQNEELVGIKNRIEGSESRLIEAQKAAKVGSWETDLSNLNVIWSEETFHIFELDPASFLPTHQSFLDYVHPDDKNAVDEAFKNSFSTNYYNTIEHRIITAKGTLKYVEERWKVSNDHEGKPVRVFGTCQDISERKKIEQELITTKAEIEANEHRLKLALEAASLGIWEWNIVTNELTWDDRTYEIQGQSKGNEANLYNNWLNSLILEDRERMNQEVQAAVNGEKPFNTTYRILKSNGELQHIKTDGLVLFDQKGKPYHMIGVVRDVTDNIAYEARIKQSEEKHRAIIENLSEGIVLVDENFDVIYQSPSVQRIVGFTLEDRKNKIALDFIHPDDLHICEQQYLESKSSQGKPIISQYRTRHKDGKYIWIDVAITNLLHLESVRAYVVIYRDITERKRFEEQLALSSLIVDSSEDAILSVDLESVITSWNKGAEKVFGYTREEAIGKSIYMLIPPDLQGEEKMISDSIRCKEPIDAYETIRINKSNKPVQVAISASPILDQEGNVMASSKILRDITSQKAVEKEKAKIMSDLIQRNRDLEQFAYIISHNLRAPVANIIGINKFLVSPEIGAAQKDQLNQALSKSVALLDSTIKDLNNILQVKRAIDEQMTSVDLSQLLENLRLSISGLISKEQVTFEIDLMEVNEMVTIKSYIYSIFYNLITNSIKYRQALVNPIIQIIGRKIGDSIVFVFRDNGLGIDLENKGEQIFGLYKRFHYHTEGKGMGLFMVKTQVETLGGKISIKSEVNKGTEFTLEFPQPHTQ